MHWRPAAHCHARGHRTLCLSSAALACVLTLFVPATQAQEVIVPALKGLSAQQASQQLQGLGLTPKFLLGPAPPEARLALQVTAQQPSAGSAVAAGTVVEVTIYAQAPNPSQPAGTRPDGTSPRSTTPASNNSNSTAGIATPGTPLESAPGHRVADHQFDGGDVRSLDLQHGRGPAQLQVIRQWNHADSPGETMGPGWGDRNVIRQVVESDRISLVRGGRTEISLPRQADGQFGTGQVSVRQSANGWEWTTSRGERLIFDASQHLVSVTSPTGGTTTYTWDAQGRLETIRRGNSNVLGYHYDGDSSRVTRIDGPEELACHYEYDAAGRLQAVVNSQRVRIEYQYDAERELSTVSDQFGRRLDLNDADQLQLVRTQPDSREGLGADERLQRLMSRTDELAIAAGFAGAVRPAPQPEIERDENGRVIQQTVRGRVTRYRYDEAGQLTEASTPEGDWAFEYDQFGRRQTIQRPDGLMLRYDYTSAGQVRQVTSSNGTSLQIDYDDHFRPTRWHYGDGRTIEARYGADGRRSFVKWSPDLSANYQFGATDELRQLRVSSGWSARFEYDGKRRPIQWQFSTGVRGQIGFDDADHVSSISWGNHRRQYEWSADGLLLGISDPIFGQRRFDYSRWNEGEISYSWQGQGVWRRQLNAWRQPVSFQRPSGQTWRYEYGVGGLLSGITTPGGRTWHYDRDAAGRVLSVTATDRPGIELTRTAEGRITHVRRSGISQREFTWGADGRVQVVKSPLGLVATYNRDPAGRIVEVQAADGRIQVDYDDHGLLQGLIGPNYEIRQEFHPDGQLARRSYLPAGLELQLPRDAQGRSAGITLDGISVGYGYDPDGRVATLSLPDGSTIELRRDSAGRVTELSLGAAATISRQLDPLSRPVSLSATSAQGTPLFWESYAYDPAGNLARLDSVGGGSMMLTYDADDRLVRVNAEQGQTTFGYTPEDDLRSVTQGEVTSLWNLDNSGRPRLRDLDVVYDWDTGGNLTALQSVDADIGHEFSAGGLLLRRSVAGLEWQFGYLPSGDRLWKEGPGGRVHYAWLASRLAGFRDEAGVSWLLVTIPGTDQPLALCSSDGQTLFLICDRLGSIRRAVNPAGELIGAYDFGPFGQLRQAEGFVPLLMYAGMMCDEHGLYAARRRYYDPSLMRFISLDPSLGHAGQPNSFNPYAYAANNPYRYRDPWGAAPEPVSGGGLLMSGKTSEEDRTAARFFAQTPQQRAALDLVFAAEDLQDSVQSGINSALDLLPSPGQLSPWSASDADAAAASLADWADEPAADDILGNILALDPNDDLFAPWTPGAAASAGGTDTSAPSGTQGTQPALQGIPGTTSPATASGASADGSAGSTDAGSGALPVSRPMTADGIISQLFNDGADADANPVQPVDPKTASDRWYSNPEDFLPKARRRARQQGPAWIEREIRRNRDEGRWPFVGIVPQPTADDDRRLNQALDRAREVLRRARAEEQELEDAAYDFGRKAVALDDLVNELTGPGQPLDGIPQGNPKLAFDDLRRETRKLRQMLDDFDDPPRTSVADEALARANEARDEVCGTLQRGYDPANAEQLRREADAEIARARSALEVANDLNRQRREAEENGDALRQQMQKVSELADKLEPLFELRDEVRQNRDQLQQARDEFQAAYDNYTSMFWRSPFEFGPTDAVDVPEQMHRAATEVEELLDEFWFDPQAAQLLQSANMMKARANGKDSLGKGRSDSGGSYTLSQPALLQRLLGDRAPAIYRANELLRLDQTIPEDAELLLQDARAAVSEGKQLLDRLAEENEKQLEKDQATAFEAWEVLRAAEDCRNRFTGGPATGPLTGNITTSELARQISPRIARLIPRPPMRESPHGPTQPAGHPTTTAPTAGQVTVPNVVGQSGPQATVSLRGRRLKPKFMLGKPAPSAEQAFHVYEQSPAAGSVVAPETFVDLTLYGTPQMTVGSTPRGPVPFKVPEKPTPKTGNPLPAPRKRPPEPKPTPTKSVKNELNGTWSIAGRYNRVATSFKWQQINANSAVMTFKLDGFEPTLLGIGGEVSVTMNKSGNSYVSGKDVGNLSKVLTQQITVTPTGRGSMTYRIQQSNGESASGTATKR